ncbi:MAG: hypothetical protein ACFB14_18175 [Leptolyngbyaceae cyanobacterium]
MVATQLRSRKVLGLNQRQYEGLKTALQLNLRRQVLIAVCDSDTLQTQLVSRLQADLSVSDGSLDDFGSAGLAKLDFDPGQPDLMLQLVQWIKQAPKPTPHLQVVGLEAMTQQSMRSQNYFLRSLESIQSLLPHLESSLVLWLSWPWYRTLKQSAPDFWQWRSGVFTFVGEPVPMATDAPAALPIEDGLYGDVSAKQSPDIWQILSKDLAQLEHSDEALDEAPSGAVAVPRIEQTEEEPVAIDVTALDNPLETISQWEEQGATAAEITDAYRTLGNHYRDRIEAGEMTPSLLARAIETFERYLHKLPKDDAQRSAGLNDLGTLYWLQAQNQSERADLIAGMNRSAEQYQAGLACKSTDADTYSR